METLDKSELERRGIHVREHWLGEPGDGAYTGELQTIILVLVSGIAGEFEMIERLNDARRHYEIAMQSEPKHAGLRKNLGIICIICTREGNLSEACKHWEAAAEIDKQFDVLHYNIACFHASQGNIEAATKELQLAVDHGFHDVGMLTRDAWGDALGISPGGTTYPIVFSCDYSKGKFYVLTIPNDPADLYAFPPTVLSVIRATVGSAEPIRIDSAPAQVALFRYDNNTFIVQNYLPTSAEVTVSVAGTAAQIHDLLTGQDITPAPAVGRGFGGRGPTGPPPRTSFTFTVLPHSYMAFTVKKVYVSSNTIN